jgi:SAM-dependent methyltransferase
MYSHYLPVYDHSISENGPSESYWTQNWKNKTLHADVQSLRLTPESRAIRARVSAGSRILEAGCGLGQWVRYLNTLGYHTTGIDFSRATISRLKTELPGYDWRVGDVTALPFSTEEFDAIISWGVIEHFETGPGHVLSEYLRVLRTNGWLFITVPYLNWRRKWIHRGRLNNRSDFQKEQSLAFHQHILTSSEISEWIKNSGFVLDRTVVTSRIPGAQKILYNVPDSLGIFKKMAVRLTATLVPAHAIGQMIMVVAKKPDSEFKNCS